MEASVEVRKLVLHLKKHNIPIAVATGSRRRNYEMKTGHLGEIFGCFEGKVVCADDTQYAGMRGRPNPDIFLIAAREMLGRNIGSLAGEGEEVELSEEQIGERRKGLVFEDALPGMQAGKRAGMSGELLSITDLCTDITCADSQYHELRRFST